jgi:hypothetical protein
MYRKRFFEKKKLFHTLICLGVSFCISSSFVQAFEEYVPGVSGINGDRIPYVSTPPFLSNPTDQLDTYMGDPVYFDNERGNFVVVRENDGSGFEDNNPGPQNVDPRSHERWRNIGDFNSWGDGYGFRNTPCTGAPGEDTSRCNSTCQVLDFWTCDTRPHNRPNRVEVLVNGVVYDTILPTISRPGFTDMSWANLSKYNYTPSCGDSPSNLYSFEYQTPVAWKDGVTRTIQLRSRVDDADINEFLYRSNTTRSSYGPIMSASDLVKYGLTTNPNINYRLMYTDSTAPTTVLLPNAGWDQANKDGDSNDITSFSITCPVLPGRAMDLTGQILSVPDRIVNQSFTQNGTVRNVGDASSGGTNTDIVVRLQYDFNRNGFTNNSGGDFTVNTTIGDLAAGASSNVAFSSIELTRTGPWQVRMTVDPDSVRETDVATRGNNRTGWQTFLVTAAPGTPTLDVVTSCPVDAGEDITLGWFSQNLRNNTCVASGSWGGARDENGFILVPTTAAGAMTFTLTCTGTNNQTITDTATCQVIGSTPDLLFTRISYDTCSPTEQNPATGVCPNTTVSLRIKNQGIAIPSTEAIPYRLERWVNGVWTAISGASGTLAGLGAGQESGTIILNVPNLQAGVSQRFRAQVNQPNTNADIGETRFTNNATSTPYFTIPPLPTDYRFVSFTTATCPTTAAQNMTTGVCPSSDLSFVIQNDGANTPSGQRIPYRIEKETSTGSWTSAINDTIAGLAAGARTGTITESVANLGEGTHTYRVRVNFPEDDDLFESDMADNITNPRNVVVPQLPPQCNNNDLDDNDPEDTLADEDDPGCWSNADPFVPSYNATDDNETEAVTPPRLKLTASPNIVRYGATATINYEIESLYDVTCVLQGPGMSTTVNYTYTPGGVVSKRTGLDESTAITGTQRFTITCTPPAGTVDGVVNPDDASASVMVDVIPQAQEI